MVRASIPVLVSCTYRLADMLISSEPNPASDKLFIIPAITLTSSNPLAVSEIDRLARSCSKSSPELVSDKARLASNCSKVSAPIPSSKTGMDADKSMKSPPNIVSVNPNSADKN